MANVAIFKTGETARYLTSVDTGQYAGDPDVLINPDVTAVAGQPLRYWKRDGDEVELMTQGERDAVDAADLADLVEAVRAASVLSAAGTVELGMVIRAMVIVTIDELNDIRAWLRDLKVATANAGTLAAFKTNVAALPAMNDRTTAQARTALTNHIEAGDAD